MTTTLYSWTEIGSSTTGVHALHDEAINQIEGFLGDVFEIAVDNVTVTFTPTAAQCQENAVFKFVDDTTVPDDYIHAIFALTNMPARIFHVWNATSDVTIYPHKGSGLQVHGVLNGEISSFYWDGTEIYPINLNNDKLTTARTACVLADITGGVLTGLDSGETLGGVALDYGDWVLITDQEPVYRTPGITSGSAQPHPYTSSSEATKGKRCLVTAGDDAGKIFIFNGTTWEQDISMQSTVTSEIVIGGFVAGTPAISSRIYDNLEVDGIDFADDFAGSLAELRTGPTGSSIVFDVQVNDVSIGGITFTAAATAGTFATTAAAESVDPGETLSIVTPADLKSAADFTFSFKGTAQ